MAIMRLTRALFVRLNQPQSELALDLKPHMEPLFDLPEQILEERRAIPHGHHVQHQDHHTQAAVKMTLLGL